MAYTLMMDKHKVLKVTQKINLLQRDTMVDKIVFYTDHNYSDEIDLSDFQARVEYIDPNNTAHMEILTADEELYKEKFIRYTLPVTSEISQFAGTIKLKLVFLKYDASTTTVYKLTSTETEIEILSTHDYFAWVDSTSLTAIDNAILNLETRIEELEELADIYDSGKADNIAFNTDGDVQLKAKGSFIGDAISVAVPGTEDDLDDSHDGVIDADEIYNDESLLSTMNVVTI